MAVPCCGILMMKGLDQCLRNPSPKSSPLFTFSIFFPHGSVSNPEVIIFEIMAVYNSTQVLLNVYEVCAIFYDMVSSDFHLDTLSGS